MYEDEWPLDTPQKARAFLLTEHGELVCLARIKPDKPVYHVTIGGKLEPGESTEAALTRELKEEVDAEAIIGRPFLTLLDTTYHVALLKSLGPNPFSGPEFANPEFGRYEIEQMPLWAVTGFDADLQPYLIGQFLEEYGQAVLAEGRRLQALDKSGS